MGVRFCPGSAKVPEKRLQFGQSELGNPTLEMRGKRCQSRTMQICVGCEKGPRIMIKRDVAGIQCLERPGTFTVASVAVV